MGEVSDGAIILALYAVCVFIALRIMFAIAIVGRIWEEGNEETPIRRDDERRN